jgi:hypothetical protein
LPEEGNRKAQRANALQFLWGRPKEHLMSR